ncbi:MAG: hypothetical protein FWF73_00710 [Spirochaetes bacterium]|nr:hypothetical protein [Spirochaetota bacterium]
MKRKYFLALTLVAAIACNLYALDITEPFSPGIVTDFEGYYGRTFPKEGDQKNFSELIVGGGFTENFSYFFSGSAASDFKSVESVGLNLIWQFISTEGFTSCLIPHAAFIADDDEKLTAYYDLGVDIELHLSALEVIHPYLGAGYSYTQNRKESNDYMWTIPLYFGIMIPVGKTGIEIFGQFTAEPCKEGTWDTITRYAAGGINYQIIENLELITEAGYEFTNKETQISVGLVFAL